MRIDVVPLATENPSYSCLTYGTQVSSLTHNETLTCDFTFKPQDADHWLTDVILPIARYVSRSIQLHPNEVAEPLFVRSWSWLCGSSAAPIFETLQEYYLYPSELAQNTDLLILLTFQPMDRFAFGRVCQHHPMSSRPTIGILNLSPKYRSPNTYDDRIYVIHELFHLLGFNEDYWSTDPTVRGSSRFPSPPIPLAGYHNGTKA
jgi:hypothetical protein